MGYIAPVRMLQYTEYQKRDQEKTKDRDPMPVHFVPKIRLRAEFQLRTSATQIPFNDKNVRGIEREAFKKENFPHETGKGLYLNEYV
ncbi:hypothetical protein J6TS1_36960 [Siminovitchia terrae]|uniref:Uncharacterized protein n=1 Tax=Siminovitchia terrae TaxID=1914933 RepID=A0ABQ4L1U3_SIMTE|nr:hypothetical protein [Siminovitchia terrae]GIN97826.1 hypothetical protein J6TS1_36960 [Siminovitchia terrae]